MVVKIMLFDRRLLVVLVNGADVWPDACLRYPYILDVQCSK